MKILFIFLLICNFNVIASDHKSLVISYHSQATKIGNNILKSGGNAFDAFVSVTLAQYVLTEGVTSVAGPLYALFYQASSKKVLYLDGGWNNPQNTNSRWDPKNPKEGKEILIPGALRALELLNKKYGNLSFQECLRPVIDLAKNGIKVTRMLHKSIEHYANLLKKSRYGQITYFKNGAPLSEGDILYLPEVASFFSSVAKKGANYMYVGGWAKKLVLYAKKLGGKISLKDMSKYQAVIRRPRKISFGDFDVYANSGRSFGGISTLLALKVLENWKVDLSNHYSNNATELEILIRVIYQTHKGPWLYSFKKLDDNEFIEQKLSSQHAANIWKKAINNTNRCEIVKTIGSHSYQVIVTDKDGNTITGINTINAMPWGKGHFIQGIPLSDAGSLANDIYFGTFGGRRIDPLAMHFVLKNETLKMASGKFWKRINPSRMAISNKLFNI